MKFYTHGDPARPLIVMLPGFFCPAKALDYVYDKLVERFYVIVAEYNGHYPGSTFTTRQGEAAEVVAYLQEQGISTVKMIFGQSMGGEVAMELLRQLLDTDIAVENVFMDGAPCIRLSKPCRAFMYFKFKRFIHLMRDKTPEDVLKWKFLKKLARGDTESLRPLIEGCIQIAPYLTDESIRAETDCCYTFDFPQLEKAEQKKLYIFYAKGEKAHKTCYKGIRKAYPFARYKVMSGFGHITYSVKENKNYIRLLEDICRGAV